MTISRTTSAWSRPLAGTALSKIYELEEMIQEASEKRQAAEMEDLLGDLELVHLNFITLDFGEKASHATCAYSPACSPNLGPNSHSLSHPLSLCWRGHHAPSLSLTLTHSPSFSPTLQWPWWRRGACSDVDARRNDVDASKRGRPKSRSSSAYRPLTTWLQTSPRWRSCTSTSGGSIFRVRRRRHAFSLPEGTRTEARKEASREASREAKREARWCQLIYLRMSQ